MRAEIEEIKERLAAASPGGWYFTASQGNHLEELCFNCDDQDVPVLNHVAIGEEQAEANWDLCATAPASLRFLIGEVERLEKDLKKAKIALLPQPIPEGIVPGAEKLEDTRARAQYWLKAGDEAEIAGDKGLNYREAVNHWKNQAYALAFALSKAEAEIDKLRGGAVK